MALDEESFPNELQDRLTTFDDALTEIEDVMNKFHQIPISDIHAEISALEKAKLDLVGAYTMNSLFWMYMSVTGENPKDHGIKQELDRIKGYMGRVKEIEDKEKAPKLDKDASKRFIRSALWMEAQKKSDSGASAEKKARTEEDMVPSVSEKSGPSAGPSGGHSQANKKQKRKKSKHKH